MKYFLTLIMLLVLMASCKKANSNQDVCNMLYYSNDSDVVEVMEVEPELIPVPLDTAVLNGSWKLVQYHSPYFTILPTDKFDYIIKFSGSSIEMKFAANELLSEYTLHGDSLRLGNGIMTQARGGDVLLEKAIYELLMNRNLTIQCAKSPELYIYLMGKDEIGGNTFADFRKIE